MLIKLKYSKVLHCSVRGKSTDKFRYVLMSTGNHSKSRNWGHNLQMSTGKEWNDKKKNQSKSMDA